MPPKQKLSRTRKAFELAKKRKPTGRINKDDIANALSSLGLTPGLKAKLIKQMKQAGGITSSDALKANAAMLKKQFGKRKSIQSKGPVGTRLKKVSKLGK
mgnify:CR=1 FL=1|tara:strand:- start:41 stop:340 length:300 start_codon:yes stop_codon:yes gene_type:complete